VISGKGRFIFADGSYYVGDYKNNKPDGFGRSVSLCGTTSEGSWANGKPHGDITIKYKNGESYSG